MWEYLKDSPQHSQRSECQQKVKQFCPRRLFCEIPYYIWSMHTGASSVLYPVCWSWSWKWSKFHVTSDLLSLEQILSHVLALEQIPLHSIYWYWANSITSDLLELEHLEVVCTHFLFSQAFSLASSKDATCLTRTDIAGLSLLQSFWNEWEVTYKHAIAFHSSIVLWWLCNELWDSLGKLYSVKENCPTIPKTLTQQNVHCLIIINSLSIKIHVIMWLNMEK